MVVGFLSDLKMAASVFQEIRAARKNGCTVAIKYPIKYAGVANIGPLGSMEGIILSNFHGTIGRATETAWAEMSHEERYRFAFTPKPGEYLERAKLLKARLAPHLTQTELYTAMNAILHKYRQCKKGAAV